jgi:hypothetical protein
MASNPAIFPAGRHILQFPVRRPVQRLTVSAENLADYSSIQDAVNDAHDGDTIVIDGGIYLETLVIDKAVHLVGPCDPRFASDELDCFDETPYALVIGSGDVAITWTANGGSIRDMAISLVSPEATETSTLVRIPSGSLQMRRCVLSEGAHVAVDCVEGSVEIARCHIRNVTVGVSVLAGSAVMERTHIEGAEICAVTVEPTARIAMKDCCLEGRTVLRGDVLLFEGNDIDVLFVHRSLALGNNRISSLVHLCDFGSVGEVAVGL